MSRGFPITITIFLIRIHYFNAECVRASPLYLGGIAATRKLTTFESCLYKKNYLLSRSQKIEKLQLLRLKDFNIDFLNLCIYPI